MPWYEYEPLLIYGCTRSRPGVQVNMLNIVMIKKDLLLLWIKIPKFRRLVRQPILTHLMTPAATLEPDSTQRKTSLELRSHCHNNHYRHNKDRKDHLISC